MAKRTLTAVTDYGTFSRKTDHDYTHIVVVLPTQADVEAANQRAAEYQRKLEWAHAQPQVSLQNWREGEPRGGYIATGSSWYHINGYEKDARDSRRYADCLAARVAQGHGQVVSWHSRHDLAEKAADQYRRDRQGEDRERGHPGRTVLVLPVRPS